MTHAMQDDNLICRNVQTLLSDYVDNTLPARQMFEVEKHLTECAGCADLSRQTEATVRLLHTAPRYDTADDFMAKLHARLDGLEPEPLSVRNGWNRALGWLAGMQEMLRAQRMPALGLGMAVVALVGMVMLNRPVIDTTPDAPASPGVSVPLQQNVALAAGNPFDDPVAANLEANSALKDAGATADTQE